MDPLPVEITNQTDWWQPYVPPLVGFLGSVLVALVALYSIRRSTETSEKAITSADIREREKWKIDSARERENWHRENLMRLCSEALRVTRAVQQHYTDAAAACITSSDLAEAQRSFRAHMDAAQSAIDKVVPLHYEIDLLGESRVAFEFLEFREVAVFITPAVQQFHDYLVANFDHINELDLYERLEWRRYYKASAHITRAISNFKSVAQWKLSPDSTSEDPPPRPEPWPTPEGEPDAFYGSAKRRNSIYMRPSPFDWNAGDTADPSPG